MSKIDLLSVSCGTCVEVEPSLSEQLTGIGAAPGQQGGCHKAMTDRTVGREPAAAYRATAAAADLGAIGACIATVLTHTLKVCALLLPRLRHERRAMDSDAPNNRDFLDRIYNATLDRLSNNWSEPSWWRKVIKKAQGDYILPRQKTDSDPAAPHFLRIASVREWLSDYYVRDDLKALATEAILGGCGVDTAIRRDRLAQAYANYTFDDPSAAGSAIDTAVSGLFAGVLSSLSASEQIMVNLMRAHNLRINRSNAEVLSALSRIESMLATGPQKQHATPLARSEAA
jgi:hypothetical protein